MDTAGTLAAAERDANLGMRDQQPAVNHEAVTPQTITGFGLGEVLL